MSDPAKTTEIEDVLSSIRKLVSADERPEKDADTPSEPAAERLVLTPSLRVDDSDQKAAPDTEPYVLERALQDEAFAQTTPDETTSDAPPADLSSETEHNQDIAERDASETEDEVQEEADADENVTADADTSPSLAEPDDLADTDATPAPSAKEGLDHEGGVAVFQHAASITEPAWEPDVPTEDAHAEAIDAPERTSEDSADADMTSDTEPEPKPLQLDHIAGPVAADDPESDGAVVLQPDTSVAAELSAEIAPPAANPQADPPSEPLSEPGNAFLADDLLEEADDALLDEEMLRDLVTEIVRQELQGALGERITRNVRKLVRREIQRALTTRELE